MVRWLLALLVALLPAQALSQATVLQGGPYTAGQLPVYSQSGGAQPTVRSSGAANGQGFGVNELSLIARGTGSPPFASQGTGPLGTNSCNYDGPVTGAFHYLCSSPNANGGGLIVYGSGGGASQLPLKFIVNGEVTTWPPSGTGSNIGYGANVTDYGAVCDGVTNDTAGIQATIDAIQSGNVNFPPRTCVVAGTINITTNGITLNGSGWNTTTISCSGTGTADCIKVGFQADYKFGVKIQNMTVTAPLRTGGHCVNIEKMGNVLVQWVNMNDCYNSARVDTSNSITFQNFWMNDINGDYGLIWTGPTDGVNRSDVLQLTDGVIQALYQGGDCMRWDGLANTLRISNVGFLRCNYGMHVMNTANSPTLVPGFLFANDLEIEGAMTASVRIDAGYDYHFSNSYISNFTGAVGQGDADTDCIIVNADAGVSITRNVFLTGSHVGVCRGRGIFFDAQGLHITGTNFRATSLEGASMWPVVSLGPNSVLTDISGLSTYEFGNPINASYAVEMLTGAQRINLCGINATGVLDGMISNPGSVVSFSLCPGIDQNGLGTGVQIGALAPDARTLSNLVADNAGAETRMIVSNPSATSGSQARLDLISNSGAVLFLINQAATPTAAIATSPGTTGGFLLDTSAEAGSGIVLKPGASSIVNALGTMAATSFQLVRPFAYSTAPSIASGFGTSPSITHNNGTAGFRVNVGTGGVATNGTITMPSSPSGWACSAQNSTSANSTQFVTLVTNVTATSITLRNFDAAGAPAAWAASDIVYVQCMGL